MISKILKRAITTGRFVEVPLQAKLKDAKSSLRTPLEVH